MNAVYELVGNLIVVNEKYWANRLEDPEQEQVRSLLLDPPGRELWDAVETLRERRDDARYFVQRAIDDGRLSAERGDLVAQRKAALARYYADRKQQK